MDSSSYFYLLVGMVAVTYLTRYPSLWYFARRPMPAWLAESLQFLPAATLSALITPMVFGDKMTFDQHWPLWVAVCITVGLCLLRWPPIVVIGLAFVGFSILSYG